MASSDTTTKSSNIEKGENRINLNGEKVAVGSNIDEADMENVIPPHSQLPKPEAPPGVGVNRSQSLPESVAVVKMPAIGIFFREKSNSLSSSITKGLSTLKDEYEKIESNKVTEFDLSGLKVVVNSKNNTEEDDDIEKMDFKGKISLFTRSSCRDCTAVGSFLRERNLRFVEINIDVFGAREKELIERTGIFFNEKLVGGLVVLNSLRNSGMLEHKLKDLLSRKCPVNAPAPPVYGFDDPEEQRLDEMVGIVRVLRQRLPIQERMMKIKIVKNCFSGGEMVDSIMKHYSVYERIKELDELM